MVEKIDTKNARVNIACLIHGDVYGWDYVDRLYSMVQRNFNRPTTMHVYTEQDRPVPAPYVKHELIDWGISGPKKSWWYKMQLFNTEHHQGPLLYLDLDTVIVGKIDWICQLTTDLFWAVRDFKYLWKPHTYNINSSVMWWDTTKFAHIWQGFKEQELTYLTRKYHGDQDFLDDHISQNQRRCFDSQQIKSWRWQCLDGGFDFQSRRYLVPGQGTRYDDNTKILIFHGRPKPNEIRDPVIKQHWQ